MGEYPLCVVGLQGGEWFGRAAAIAINDADVIVGSARHLDGLEPSTTGEQIGYESIGELVDLVGYHLGRGRKVCVLASGDPGFFGAARLLTARFGPAVVIHPAPSAVSLAFARVGLSWDDAAVVSAHGRALDHRAIAAEAKVAVLTSPETPPQAVGAALPAEAERVVWVCSRLGEPDEAVVSTDVAGLAAGRFDPLSVVVLARPGVQVATTPTVVGGPARAATAGFGRPVAAFAHRAGMITKPEVRAVVLSKLDLHPGATLWDVGAGSGAVCVEAARLAPGLRAWAIERRADDCRRIAANAAGLAVSIMEGEAPECFEALPEPDRIFVGGGGIDVLDAACARVAAGGVVAASFASLDRAGAAAARLGNLVQIAVNRAVPVGPDGAWRLDADNPVFVAWGTIR